MLFRGRRQIKPHLVVMIGKINAHGEEQKIHGDTRGQTSEVQWANQDWGKKKDLVRLSG